MTLLYIKKLNHTLDSKHTEPERTSSQQSRKKTPDDIVSPTGERESPVEEKREVGEPLPSSESGSAPRGD